MLSIIDKMDIKSWLHPLREGDMYEINGKNYYNEELLFDHLPKTDESEEDVNERLDKLNAAVSELEWEVDELMKVRRKLRADRDKARELAEQFRDLLQANGVLFENHLLPWEDK